MKLLIYLLACFLYKIECLTIDFVKFYRYFLEKSSLLLCTLNTYTYIHIFLLSSEAFFGPLCFNSSLHHRHIHYTKAYRVFIVPVLSFVRLRYIRYSSDTWREIWIGVPYISIDRGEQLWTQNSCIRIVVLNIYGPILP